MSKLGDIQLLGKSGRSYAFEIYDINTAFNSVGAVYAFTKRAFSDSWRHSVKYIGITNDLKERFNNHHKIDACKASGCDCVLIHLDSLESSRIDKEVDLITHYAPTHNEVHK